MATSSLDNNGQADEQDPDPAADRNAAFARGPNRRGAPVGWSDVTCDRCGKLQGRYKLDDDPNLGAMKALGRWEVQVWEHSYARWGFHYPCLTKRLASIVGAHDTWAKEWLKSYRTCC